MLRAVKKLITSIVPQPMLERIISFYHFSLAWLGAFLYNHPARKLIVIGVTGTKGKSSTSELLNAIFEEAGYRTALINSIRIKKGANSEPNLMRMTMPGRFFIQKFLFDALNNRCEIAIIEMTSEGARQHRHRFLELNALIFTNLAPEHIESHGSYESYANMKFEIGKELARSRKRPRIIVANADDKEAARYLTLPVESALPFTLSACTPYSANEKGGHFFFDGLDISTPLPGEFSLKNALAAATLARAFGVDARIIASAFLKMNRIAGRAERIDEGQDFAVIVDYAHTPDSLEALYDAYSPSTSLDMARNRSLGVKRRLICVLGATGGGRDTWKRPVMGALADKYCADVILTNEDPYDEDPRAIAEEVASGMSARGGSVSGGKRPAEIIMDRREAIRHALSLARAGDAVLITGKGTDPCICVARGEQIPWSDADVARKELLALARSAEV